MQPQSIAIADYTYVLPDARIALHPLPERDASKLLVYKDGVIQEGIYRDIAGYLPAGSLLVFNDTRVINARLRFKKPTGGNIELFCLEPSDAISEYSTAMNRQGNATWKCMVGGAGKWKSGTLTKNILIQDTPVQLEAVLLEKLPDARIARFSWTPDHLSFAEVIAAAGEVPLPPYIRRGQQADDAERYQTIYARLDGSVAAPTAGLHFTNTVFEQLAAKHIGTAFVTLHVGAGTFKPVKASVMQDHEMHAEWISVTVATLQVLIDQWPTGIVAVGTTSLRTLESLYWLGVKVSVDPGLARPELGQWDAYDAALNNAGLSAIQALTTLQQWLQQNRLQQIFTNTRLLIAPGYRFRMVKAIVTNFHQPQSTLLLLIAAAVGPAWRQIYDYALANDFRFLSYGDGSLLYLAPAADQ